MTSSKCRDTDDHFICISPIVIIRSLRLVSRLLFAGVVLFQLTNIKLITNIKKLICGVTDLSKAYCFIILEPILVSIIGT